MLYAGNLSKKFIGMILVAMTLLLGFTNSVGATLIDNSDGTVTDDDLGIMWLQQPISGDLTWDEAMTWAANLVFAGYDNWRLPSANHFDTGLPDTTWWSVNNEWGHLYGVEWDNPANEADEYPMSGYYPIWWWTSTEDPGDSSQAYAFFLSWDGLWLNDEFSKSEILHVTAVRDVGAKVNTVLDFWFTPNPANPGETVELSGTLKDEYGDPVYPAEVDVEYSLDGGVTWNYIWTLNTNAAGEFSQTFPAPGVGTYLVRVSYAGSASYNPSSHTETLIVEEPTLVDTSIDFMFQPHPANPGETVELYGTLTEVGGSPVYPAHVDVEYSLDGGVTWNYIWTLNTNAAGEFSQTFPAPGIGTYLVRVSYGGSPAYNPSSHTETLIVEPPGVWGDYHFQISPFIDVLHLKIDGSVIYGICDYTTYHNQPVLGYIEGSTFYLFIDFTKDDLGDPIYYELAMLVGSTSTLSGDMYRTIDGTSWVGPTSFSLVAESSSPESSTTGQALASPAAVEPEGWPATYHFQLSPWIDIVHLHLDGPVLHGLDDAAGFYSDQPVLGFIGGDFFVFAIDWTKDDFGDPIYNELGMIVGSVSTISGYAYRTTDGKSVFYGPTINLVPV